jgi:hypothetical protein
MHFVRSLALSFSVGLITLSLSPEPARAQSNAALAEELFREGQRLLEAGKTHEACERLAASQSLDPALGTLINLALCHERDGKTATAWSEYSDAAAEASKSGEKDRETFARERAAALEKQLSRLVIAIDAPPEGVAIKLDGQPLPASALGTAIPVDPGDHALAIDAPRKKPWTRSPLTVAAGAGVLQIRVSLEDEDAPAHAAEAATGASTRRTTGYVVGAIGIAGIATGVVLLARASALDTQSRDEAAKANLLVPADPTLKSAAISDHDAAITHQTIGLVAGGVGAAAIGVGLYLVFASRAEDKSRALHLTPRLGPSHAGIDIGAAF